MAITVTLNGVDYTIPSPGESSDWGDALNAYLVALSTASGAFTLGNVNSHGSPNAKGATFASGILNLNASSGSYPGTMSSTNFNRVTKAGQQPGGEAITTDDTLTTITIEDISQTPGSVFSIEAYVCGVEDGGGADVAGYGLAGVFKNVAGTVTQVGSTTVLWSKESDAAWDCVLAVVSDAVVVRVTGAVATTIVWQAQARCTCLAFVP